MDLKKSICAVYYFEYMGNNVLLGGYMRKLLFCFSMCLLVIGYGACVGTNGWKYYQRGIDNSWGELKNTERIFIYMGENRFLGLDEDEDIKHCCEYSCIDDTYEKYSLKQGDIVEIKGDIRVLWGVGISYYIDKIHKLKVLEYEDVDEKKLSIVQKMAYGMLPPSYLYESYGKKWYYIINEDTDEHINIYESYVEGEWAYNVIVNGEVEGRYSSKRNVYLDDRIHICFVSEEMTDAQIMACINQGDFSNMFYLGKSEKIDLAIEASNSQSILDNGCISEFPIRIKDICSYEEFAIAYEKDIMPQLERGQIYNELKGSANILVVEAVEQSQFYNKGEILLLVGGSNLENTAKNKVYNLTLSSDSYFKVFSPESYSIYDTDHYKLDYCGLTYKK